jgi:hypothetical protein
MKFDTTHPHANNNLKIFFDAYAKHDDTTQFNQSHINEATKTYDEAKSDERK